MRAIWIVLALVASACILPLLAGLALPREFHGEAAATIAAPAPTVWALATDAPHFPVWQPGLVSVTAHPADPIGMGTIWEFRGYTKVGLRTWESKIVEWVPGRRFTQTTEAPIHGAWTVSVSPSGPNQSRVTCEGNYVVGNPYFRLLASDWLTRGMSGEERYLGLLRHMAETGTPEPGPPRGKRKWVIQR